jgi:N6-L-threonylcarbamoyladenine synthase
LAEVTILAIESSCDDTSAAVVRDGYVLSNLTANQDIHRSYGGVVPELASRAHQANIVPVIDQAIKKAGISLEEISAVAFTRGPGLLGSLLVGTSFAKGFALARKIPLIEVNHLQAHVLAHFILEKGRENNIPSFPFLCLLVSGGHTQLIIVKSHFEMEVIGNTIDDAAGEAFDKCGKMMGFPYPAGPIIDKLASEGNKNVFRFSKFSAGQN